MAFVPESEQKQRQRALDFQRNLNNSTLGAIVEGVSEGLAAGDAQFAKSREIHEKRKEAEKVAKTKAASDLATARAKGTGAKGARLTNKEAFDRVVKGSKEGSKFDGAVGENLLRQAGQGAGLPPGLPISEIRKEFGLPSLGRGVVQEAAAPPEPVAVQPVLPQIPQAPVAGGQEVPFAPTGQPSPQDFVAGLTQGLPASGTPSIGQPVTTQPQAPDLGVGSEAVADPEASGFLGGIQKTGAERREERKLKREERENRAEANLGFRKGSRQFKIVVDTADRFSREIRSGKVTSKLAAAKAILELIAQKNGLADQTVASQVLRLSGEVGVFTDADIRRASGNPAMINRMVRRLKVAAEGTITDQDREDIKNLAFGMVRAIRGVVRNTARRTLETAKAGIKASGIEVDLQNLSDGLGLDLAQQRQGETTLTDTHKILIEAIDTGKDPETGKIIHAEKLEAIRAKLDGDGVY